MKSILVVKGDVALEGCGSVVSFSPRALYDLQCYYEAIELYLASSHEERLKQIRLRQEKLDSRIREHLLSQGNVLLWQDYFPSELRATVLVSVMSFFERYLHGVCTETAILVRAPVSHRVLKGSCISRAQVFLMEICRLSAPKSESWEIMSQLQRLRNLLVHNGGMPETHTDADEARRLATLLPGCASTEFGIDLEAEFVRYVFDCTAKFLDEMASEMRSVCKRVRVFEGDA